MYKLISFKNRLIIIASVVTAFMLLLVVISSMPNGVYAQADEQVEASKRSLYVAGQGKINVEPDIAYITLGVVTEDKDAKAAQQKNAQSMSSVVELVKSAGISQQDIKTTGYSINPKYNYSKDTGESSIVGYTVSNSVQVTIRDISKTGDVIDVAASSGANLSRGISFGLSDYEKHYNEALKKAVEIAKNRAYTIADTLDIELKAPMSISENGGFAPSYNTYRGSYAVMDMAAGEAYTTPVEAGTIEVTASVNITYEY